MAIGADEQPRVVVLGACYSGTFIPALSGPGRIVVTSAAANEPSYKGRRDPRTVTAENPEGIRSGELFLDALMAEWGEGATLLDGFINARDVALASHGHPLTGCALRIPETTAAAWTSAFSLNCPRIFRNPATRSRILSGSPR